MLKLDVLLDIAGCSALAGCWSLVAILVASSRLDHCLEICVAKEFSARSLSVTCSERAAGCAALRDGPSDVSALGLLLLDAGGAALPEENRLQTSDDMAADF